MDCSTFPAWNGENSEVGSTALRLLQQFDLVLVIFVRLNEATTPQTGHSCTDDACNQATINSLKQSDHFAEFSMPSLIEDLLCSWCSVITPNLCSVVRSWLLAGGHVPNVYIYIYTFIYIYLNIYIYTHIYIIYKIRYIHLGWYNELLSQSRRC